MENERFNIKEKGLLIFENDKPIEKNHIFENNNIEKLNFNQRKENLTDIYKEKISFKNDGSIILNGKEFKIFSRFNYYKTKEEVSYDFEEG